MTDKLSISRSILKVNWLLHMVFWLISYYLMLKIFTGPDEIRKIDHVYTLLFHLVLIPWVYINLKWLLPFFFQNKGRGYLLYLLSIVTLIVAAASFNQFFFSNGVDFFTPGYYFVSEFNLWQLIGINAAYIFLTSILKLSKDWFRLSEQERSMAEVHEKTIQAEMQALRSQINPHFLFNSLNNVYALSKKSHELTSESILKLSNMLRYVLYETNSDLVSIKDEIKLIRNMIALQRLRLGKYAQISFKIEGEEFGDKLTISPLLFLPLIENSFKHGAKNINSLEFVKIHLAVSEKTYNFYIENSVNLSGSAGLENYSGIGLENLRQRLQYLYPGKHSLTISDDGEVFRVAMTINAIP